MDGTIKIQTIPNVRETNQKFETLGEKIKITPNIEGVLCNLILFLIHTNNLHKKSLYIGKMF